MQSKSLFQMNQKRSVVQINNYYLAMFELFIFLFELSAHFQIVFLAHQNF